MPTREIVAEIIMLERMADLLESPYPAKQTVAWYGMGVSPSVTIVGRINRKILLHQILKTRAFLFGRARVV